MMRGSRVLRQDCCLGAIKINFFGLRGSSGVNIIRLFEICFHRKFDMEYIELLQISV